VTAATSLGVVASTVLLAGPAIASVPEDWSNPEDVDPLRALGLLAGVPLLLIALITLAVYLPSLAGRGGRSSGGTHREWFGGPREGVEAADKVDPKALEGGQTGGARGRW
jgi:hypothetical protein